VAKSTACRATEPASFTGYRSGSLCGYHRRGGAGPGGTNADPRAGTLSAGASADLALWDATNLDALLQTDSPPLARRVWVRGRQIDSKAEACRRRLYRRRHGGISVGCALEAPAAEVRRLHQSSPLVRQHPRTPATVRAYAKGEPYSPSGRDGRGQEAAVRPDGGERCQGLIRSTQRARGKRRA